VTLLAIAGFAGAVSLGLLLLGPWAMDLLFGGDFDYGRWGLAVVALGMGFHLAAGTLNQAALARGHQRTAAVAWVTAAVAFTAWLAAGIVDDELLRMEVGYLGATVLLTALLARAAARR
jgi:O-antigen/teichoic acid export membrane protein